MVLKLLFIGYPFLYHDIVGAGFPVALQYKVTFWPSTIVILRGWVAISGLSVNKCRICANYKLQKIVFQIRLTVLKRKNRQRNNILWYNPPFSKNFSTNIEHRFLTLVDKHFPKDHKLRKIFNRNTPTERKLPPIISNLSSHRHTQGQRHHWNIHRTYRKRLQD